MAFPQSIFTKFTNSHQHHAPISPTEFHRYYSITWYVRIQFNLRLWVSNASHRANVYEPHNSINVCGRIQIKRRMQKIRAKFHLHPQGKYTVHWHWQLHNGTACRPSVSNRIEVVTKILHLHPSGKHECRSTDFDATHAEPIRWITPAPHSTEICQEA